MQWIKSHLMIVIVGSICVLSLTGLVLGYMMSSVGVDLDADSRELSRLQGIKRVNPRVIDAARTLQKDDESLLQNYFRKYQEAKQYTPLNDQVFLDNISESDRKLAIASFQTNYARQPLKLFNLLKAKDHPTASEFTEHEQETKAKQDRIDKELGPGGITAVTPPGLPNAPPVAGRQYPGTPGSDQEATRNLRMAYATTRAKEIYCYASPPGSDREASLDDRTEEVKPPDGKWPSVDDLWYAQVALWMQEDVFRALGALNEETAAKLPEEARWVAYLPVKRLIKFTMGNYIPKGAEGEGGGGGGFLGGRPGMPGGGMGSSGTELLTAGSTAVFTKRASSDTVDVVRFRLEMVVDARRLLDVLDAISKAGFYTPLIVDLSEVVLAPEDYYIYGTAPLLQMTVICEGSFMRSSYESVMPKSVKDAIAEGRAEGMAKGGGGIGGKPVPGGYPGSRRTVPRGGGRGDFREDPEGLSTPRSGRR